MITFSRGSKFATVGCGKSGLMQKDRKGWSIKDDRRKSKVQLRKEDL